MYCLPHGNIKLLEVMTAPDSAPGLQHRKELQDYQVLTSIA